MKILTGTPGNRLAALLRVLILSIAVFLLSIPGSFLSAAEIKLIPLDGTPGDHLGSSAAVDGATAIIGASTKDNYTGAAYIFIRNGNTWNQQAKLTSLDGAAGDWYGNSVAINGDTAVVGAFNKDGETGAAYVFTRTGSTWSQQARLTPGDNLAGDRFGSSVAVSGDTVVVGAYQKDNLTGAAYVFTRTGSTWSQQAKLISSDTAAGDWFGASVDINGETVVIGSVYQDGGRGAAYVFIRIGSTWNQQAKLTAADASAGDQFGCWVSISGDTVVSGARGHFFQTGAAYVFVRSGGVSWSQQGRLTASGGAASDRFGVAVDVSANAVVVGAEGTDANSGAVYVFTRTDAVWARQIRLISADPLKGDYFGNSVSISGDTVVAGARDKNKFAGAAYAYSTVIPLSVNTFSASSVGAGSATLNGGLVSLGTASAVNVYFEYGLTAGYGMSTPSQAKTTTGAFSAEISGLTSDTTYHFRARAGLDAGPDMTFTTTPPPTPTTTTPPSTTAQPPTTATVTATVTMTAAPLPTPTVTAPATPTTQPPATVTTTPPMATVTPLSIETSGAAPVGTTSATINGNLASMGSATTVVVYFEYGATPNYGNTTLFQARMETGPFSAEIIGLKPGATIHYRARADGGAAGTAAGTDMTFSVEEGQSSILLWLLTGMGVILIAGIAIFMVARFNHNRGYASPGRKVHTGAEAGKEDGPSAETNVVEADIIETLQRLDGLRQQGIISSEEFEAQRSQIIKKSLGG